MERNNKLEINKRTVGHARNKKAMLRTELPSTVNLHSVLLSPTSTEYFPLSSTMDEGIVRECFLPSILVVIPFFLSGLISLPSLNHLGLTSGFETSHSRTTDSFSGTLVSLRGAVNVTGASVRRLSINITSITQHPWKSDKLQG